MVVQQSAPQLRTIQSRDMNGKMVPLHFVNRSNQSGHAHSSKPRPTPRPQTTDDLPYGYVSPADINIPQFSRFTVSESRTSITQQQQQQQQQQQHYVNIETSRDSTDHVDGQGRSCKDPISLSESIYSVPCSLTGGGDAAEDYDNSQHYLKVIDS